MQNLPALLGIIGAVTVGVISPGPSFVMVAKAAIGSSRRDGFAAAVGIGAGSLALAGAALLGLRELFLSSPFVYLALKCVGGLYLGYLGSRIWRDARHTLLVHEGAPVCATSAPRAFVSALVTQISNPKAAITYAGVFAAFLPTIPTTGFTAAIMVSTFTVETLWYAAVALLLSSAGPRKAYLGSKTVIDRLAGAVMVLLGASLVVSTAL